MSNTSCRYFSVCSFAALLSVMAAAVVPTSHAGVSPKEATMTQIQIELDDAVILAALDDNATTQDFIARLPLTLQLKDYASTEKVGFLPDKLTTQGAPAGSTPVVGDISYYAPWGNLAIYYKDFAYSQQLVRLGRISSGIEQLHFSGEKHATIRLIHPNHSMKTKP